MACRMWAMAAWAALAVGCGMDPDTGRPPAEGPQPPGPLPFTPVFREAGPVMDIRLTALALSPDGARALTGYNAYTSEEDPGERNVAKLWDTAGDGRPLRVLKGFDGGVCMAAFLPDGKGAVLAAGSALRAYDLETGKLLWWAPVCAAGQPIDAAALSPDGRRVLTYGHDVEDGKRVRGRLKLFSAAGGKLLRAFDQDDNKDPNVVLLFSLDGKLASVAGDILDVNTGEVLLPAAYPKAFSPDGRLFVTDHRDRADPATCTHQLVLSEARGGKEVCAFDPRSAKEGERPYAHAAAFTPDGKYLISAESDGKLRRWDAASGKELWSADMGRYAGGRYAFSADGRRVLSWAGTDDNGGKDQHRRGLWDAADGKLLNGFPPRE